MRVLHDAVDAQRGGDGAPPANDDAQLGRWMHRHAVRLHVARNAHVLIGRIRNDAQGIGARPALDEIVILTALRLSRDVGIDARFAADAKTIEPRRQHSWLCLLYTSPSPRD